MPLDNNRILCHPLQQVAGVEPIPVQRPIVNANDAVTAAAPAPIPAAAPAPPSPSPAPAGPVVSILIWVKVECGSDLNPTF